MAFDERILQRFVPALLECLLLLLVVGYIPSAPGEGHCIWYGVCSNKTEIMKVNCFYNGPAKPIQQETRPILEKYCPEVAASGAVCCNNEQLEELNFGLGLAGKLIERCPSCWDNFRQHICGMTCGANQSYFLKPVRVNKYNETHQRVQEIDFHLSNTYKEATFKSCLHVQGPLRISIDHPNLTAMDLMCGQYWEENCTSQRWFHHMGDATYNVYTPFQINYVGGEEPVDGFTPYNPPTTNVPCSAALHVQNPSASDEGHCIWYGVCSNKTEYKKVNCFYDGPAKPIQEETKHILEKYCPEVAASGSVCCNNEQLTILDSNMRLAETLFERCASCWDNFRQHICGMTCGASQSDFLKPVRVTKYNETHQGIYEIDFHLSNTYKEATFNSCIQVQSPLTFNRVLDMMCGEYGAEGCTPQRWFDYMGDVTAFAPFQINYMEGDEPVDEFTPYNPTTSNVSCNAAPNPSVSGEGHCIWYGVCSRKTAFNKYNCFYDGPAKLIQEETRKYCPEVAASGSVCCDNEQLTNMQTLLVQVGQFLARCPSCWDNFRQHICGMTCGPHQSIYLKPVTVEKYNETHHSVTEIDYDLSNTYKKATFDSCIQVQSPLTGNRAMDLMCGEHGAAGCSPQLWFESMGDVTNFAQFQINYVGGGGPVGGFTPYSPTTRACNVGIDGQPGCACKDCAASCTPRTAPIIFNFYFNITIKL